MATPKESKFRYFLYDNVAKRFLEVKNGTICGRMDCDLPFPSDDLVSRKHCQFYIVGNEVYMEDLSSTNKTKVNTVPIRPNVKRRLHLNDVIEFGAQRFILTNQDRFVPPNIQDEIRRGTIYKGRLREDGRITSQVSKVFTKQTLLILDKYTYHATRLREAIFPPRPITRHEIRPRPDATMTRIAPQPRPSTVLIVKLILIFLYLIAFLSLGLVAAHYMGYIKDPRVFFQKLLLFIKI